MSFANNIIYERDHPKYERILLGLFLYNLLCNSNTLTQFKSIGFVNIFVLIYIPVLMVSYMIYYYHAFFVRKKFYLIDIFALMFVVIPFYNTICSYATLDVPIIKGLINSALKLMTPMASILFYILIKKKVTIKQYFTSLVMLSWFCIILYTALQFLVSPTVMKGQGDELVGFNPSKGGYVYRFSSYYIGFAMTYYFLDYIVKKNFTSLLLWLVFVAYMLFVDKGRAEFISMVVPIVLFMFVYLKFWDILNRLSILLITVAVIVLAIYLVFPDLIIMVYDMFKIFFLSIIGVETGEGSADVRWIEFGNAYSYILKHPEQIFFGIGVPKKEILEKYIGTFVFGDTGIIGVLMSQGIFGTIYHLAFLIYPFWAFRQIKYFRKNIYFNCGIVGCAVSFGAMMFNGGYVGNPTALLIPFTIIEYYRIEENRRKKMLQNNEEKTT